MGRHIISCQICHQSIVRGKTLSCYHAFCHACIQTKYILDNSSCIVCPVLECHKTTSLPSGIVADLEDVNEDHVMGLLKNLELSDSEEASQPYSASPVPSRPPLYRGMSLHSSASVTSSPPVSPLPRMTSPDAGDHRVKPYQTTLQSQEQIEALKKKRALLQWQLSTPDQTNLPSMTDAHKSVQRSKSHDVSSVITSSLARNSKYESVLTTPEQKEALRKMIPRLQRSLSQEKREAPTPAPVKPAHVLNLRSSKRQTKHYKGGNVANVLFGGMAALMRAGNASEVELRSRTEGPWGYQEHDHWAGRKWGDIVN